MKPFPNPPYSSFFRITKPMLTWPKLSALYEPTDGKSQTVGRLTSPAYDEFANYLIISCKPPMTMSRTMDTSTASRSMSSNMTSNFGMQTLKAEGFFTPLNISIYMAYTSFLPERSTPSLQLESNDFSSVLLSNQVTYGPLSIPSSDDLNHPPSSSNSSATSSHKLTIPPMRNVPVSPHMGFSSNYSIPPPLISIYVDDFFPFVRFQAPPFFPSQVLFPRHSGPPFIQDSSTNAPFL